MQVALIESRDSHRVRTLSYFNSLDFFSVGFSCAQEFFEYFQKRPSLNILILDREDSSYASFEVSRRLQATPGIGVIMMSDRCEVADRIICLKNGADAVVAKPIIFEELVAVIESVHRRIYIESIHRNSEQTSSFCRLDLAKRSLLLPGGQQISLTASEGQILYSLAKRSPAPVSRKVLSDCLGQNFDHYDERRLESIVSRLRRKLRCYSLQNSIKAARGKGYQLLISVITQDQGFDSTINF